MKCLKQTAGLSLILLGWGLLFGPVTNPVLAGNDACDPSTPVCYDQRSINQYACTTCSEAGGDIQDICINQANPCALDQCANDDACNNCIAWEEPYEGDDEHCTDWDNEGDCEQDVCCSFTTPIDTSDLCKTYDALQYCNTTTGNCQWEGEGTYCAWEGDDCVSTEDQPIVWTCCGVALVSPTPEPTLPPGVTPTPTPTPTPVPVCRSPYCDIDNRPGSVCVDTDVSFTADAGDPENNLSSMELLKATVALGGADWAQFARFTSTGGALTDQVGTTQFDSEGRYYVSCNAYDSAGCRCTGNPWCPWEPLDVFGIDCTGWFDCDPNGLDWQEVVAYERPSAPVNTTPAGLVCDAGSVNLRWVPTDIITRNTTYPYRVDAAPNSWDGSCTAPDYCNNTNTATSVVLPVTNCSVYDVWAHQVNSDIPDACEWSDASNEVRFWTDNSPLSAPTNISPTTGICDTTPTFTWNATTDCSRTLRYDLQVDDRINGWNGCIAPNPGDFCVIGVYGTSYTVGTRGEAALIPGHSYTWWINAVTDCSGGPTASATFNVLGVPTGATNLVESLFCGVGTAPVDFSWTPDPFAVSQAIRVNRLDNPFLCTNPGDYCATPAIVLPTTSHSTTLDLIVGQPTTDFEWWVTSTNICGTVSTARRPFSLSECRVSGEVRFDPFGDAYKSGGYCVDDFSAAGVKPGDPSYVSLDGGTYGGTAPGDGDVAADGTYSVAAPPGVHTARLYPDFGDGWVCTCPEDLTATDDKCGVYSVTSPQSNVNFYVSQLQKAWAQTVIGDTHVDGSLSVSIPFATCGTDPLYPCTPYYAIDDTVSSPGVVSYGGSTSLTGATVSTEGWLAGGTTYAGADLLFSFWKAEASSTCVLSNLADKPNATELTACANNVFEITSPSNLTLSGDWENVDETVTIFVNFADNTNPSFDPTDYKVILNPTDGITMSGGSGLLIIITNGDIWVGDTVTKIEGIYMADGTFRSCVTDDCGYDLVTSVPLQLRITGSVITWALGGSGLDFQRDLFVANSYLPGELVTYEPKYIERLPEFMERPDITWQEIAP